MSALDLYTLEEMPEVIDMMKEIITSLREENKRLHEQNATLQKAIMDEWRIQSIETMRELEMRVK